MEKSFDLLNRLFDIDNTLLNFVSRMSAEEEAEAIERCKGEKDPEERLRAALTEGECAGMVAGFNVGFVYGNMFEVVDPEGKDYVETLRKRLIHDGTLMFVPKGRVTKTA